MTRVAGAILVLAGAVLFAESYGRSIPGGPADAHGDRRRCLHARWVGDELGPGAAGRSHLRPLRTYAIWAGLQVPIQCLIQLICGPSSSISTA